MSETQVLIGCPVQLFDEGGRLLFEGKAREFDNNGLKIKIEGSIPGLKESEVYRVLVAMPPMPCEFKGRLRPSVSGTTAFALYDRQKKEIRKHPRHDVRTFALIERMVFAGFSYALRTPADVLILNISKGGIKVRAPYRAMAVGNKLEVRLNNSLVLAEVRNAIDVGKISTDYGCRFCTEETAERVE